MEPQAESPQATLAGISHMVIMNVLQISGKKPSSHEIFVSVSFAG
jgi:hypothetical protein